MRGDGEVGGIKSWEGGGGPARCLLELVLKFGNSTTKRLILSGRSEAIEKRQAPLGVLVVVGEALVEPPTKRTIKRWHVVW